MADVTYMYGEDTDIILDEIEDARRNLERAINDTEYFLEREIGYATKDISNVVNNSQNYILRETDRYIDSLWSDINKGINWIVDEVRNIDIDVSSLVGPIVKAVKDAIAALGLTVKGISDAVWALVKPGIDSLWGFIEPKLQWVWDKIAAVGNWLWSLISPAFDWVNTQLQNMAAAIDDLANFEFPDLSGEFNKIVAKIDRFVAEDIPKIPEKVAGEVNVLFLDALGPIGLIIEKLPDIFWESWAQKSRARANEIVTVMSVTKDIMKPAITTLMDGVLAEFQEELDSAPDIMGAYRSPVNYEQAANIAKTVSGIAQAAAIGGMATGAAIDAAHPIKALQFQAIVNQVVNNVGLTGLISPPFVMPFEIGLFQPMRYYYQSMYTPFIPGAQDLIRFVVREYFSQGVGSGSPAEFAKWMKYQGYSSTWSEAYWWSHWVLPAPQTLYDAFHRGIINENEVKEYIKWHDFNPTKRPGIRKSDVDIVLGTTYDQIPRVDLRRAYDQGWFDTNELTLRYRKLGYTEADAKILTDVTINWVITEEKNKRRDEIIKEFTEGLMTEATFRNEVKLYVPELKSQNLLIEFAKERKKRERASELLTAYSTQYRRRVIEDSEYRKRLGELGFTADTIEHQLRLEGVKRTYSTAFEVPEIV